MIDKTLRKATAERHGPVVVIRMTGGGDCLWMNMYSRLFSSRSIIASAPR